MFHAVERAQERYDRDFGFSDLIAVEALINAGEATLVYTDTPKMHYLVNYMGTRMLAVMNRGKIHTFLPIDALRHTYYGVYRERQGRGQHPKTLATKNTISRAVLMEKLQHNRTTPIKSYSNNVKAHQMTYKGVVYEFIWDKTNKCFRTCKPPLRIVD